MKLDRNYALNVVNSFDDKDNVTKSTKYVDDIMDTVFNYTQESNNLSSKTNIRIFWPI